MSATMPPSSPITTEINEVLNHLTDCLSSTPHLHRLLALNTSQLQMLCSPHDSLPPAIQAIKRQTMKLLHATCSELLPASLEMIQQLRNILETVTSTPLADFQANHLGSLDDAMQCSANAIKISDRCQIMEGHLVKVHDTAEDVIKRIDTNTTTMVALQKQERRYHLRANESVQCAQASGLLSIVCAAVGVAARSCPVTAPLALIGAGITATTTIQQAVKSVDNSHKASEAARKLLPLKAQAKAKDDIRAGLVPTVQWLGALCSCVRNFFDHLTCEIEDIRGGEIRSLQQHASQPRSRGAAAAVYSELSRRALEIDELCMSYVLQTTRLRQEMLSKLPVEGLGNPTSSLDFHQGVLEAGDGFSGGRVGVPDDLFGTSSGGAEEAPEQLLDLPGLAGQGEQVVGVHQYTARIGHSPRVGDRNKALTGLNGELDVTSSNVFNVDAKVTESCALGFPVAVVQSQISLPSLPGPGEQSVDVHRYAAAIRHSPRVGAGNCALLHTAEFEVDGNMEALDGSKPLEPLVEADSTSGAQSQVPLPTMPNLGEQFIGVHRYTAGIGHSPKVDVDNCAVSDPAVLGIAGKSTAPDMSCGGGGDIPPKGDTPPAASDTGLDTGLDTHKHSSVIARPPPPGSTPTSAPGSTAAVVTANLAQQTCTGLPPGAPASPYTGGDPGLKKSGSGIFWTTNSLAVVDAALTAVSRLPTCDRKLFAAEASVWETETCKLTPQGSLSSSVKPVPQSQPPAAPQTSVPSEMSGLPSTHIPEAARKVGEAPEAVEAPEGKQHKLEEPQLALPPSRDSTSKHSINPGAGSPEFGAQSTASGAALPLALKAPAKAVSSGPPGGSPCASPHVPVSYRGGDDGSSLVGGPWEHVEGVEGDEGDHGADGGQANRRVSGMLRGVF